MTNGITHVGLDAHKQTIQVALLLPAREEAQEWQIPNEPRSVKRLAKSLLREAPGEVRCCYEAGPCGYALQRQLQEARVTCHVIAPSLTPVKPGARIKTDRRDARKLAELLRAGLLTEVHPPSAEEEAVRDLCRCRQGAREDLLRSRHRLAKMLLRKGVFWTAGKRVWTKAYREWVRSLRFEHPADERVFEEYRLAVEQMEERVRGMDQALEEWAQKDPYREPVAWLRCFRGIDTVTALTLVAELHDFQRFSSPRELMAYLGLVPSEHLSAHRRRRGSLTKTGNSHVRRVLIEAAWHYRHRPAVGIHLRRRRREQPRWTVMLADKAQRRLHRRYWKLCLSGKPRNKAVVAVARELVGFVWALLSGYAVGRV